jgi:hypothetical protein
MKNLYLVTRYIGNGNYDSAVVCAENSDAACLVNLSGRVNAAFEAEHRWTSDPARVTVKHIGAAAPDVELGSMLIVSFYNGEVL